MGGCSRACRACSGGGRRGASVGLGLGEWRIGTAICSGQSANHSLDLAVDSCLRRLLHCCYRLRQIAAICGHSMLYLLYLVPFYLYSLCLWMPFPLYCGTDSVVYYCTGICIGVATSQLCVGPSVGREIIFCCFVPRHRVWSSGCWLEWGHAFISRLGSSRLEYCVRG